MNVKDIFVLCGIVLACAVFTSQLGCNNNLHLPWIVVNKVPLDSNNCTIYYIDDADKIDSFVGECDSFNVDQVIMH